MITCSAYTWRKWGQGEEVGKTGSQTLSAAFRVLLGFRILLALARSVLESIIKIFQMW